MNYAKTPEDLLTNPLSNDVADDGNDDISDIDEDEVSRYSVVVNVADNSIINRYDRDIIHGAFVWNDTFFVIGQADVYSY